MPDLPQINPMADAITGGPASDRLAAHTRIGKVTALDSSLAEATVQYGLDGTVEAVAIPEHHWLRGHQPTVGEYVLVAVQEGDYCILGKPETFFDFPPAVRVQRNVVGSSLGTGADTPLPWHETAYEYGAMWDASHVGVTGVAGTDVEIPLDGIYDIKGGAGFASTAGDGRRIVTLYKNTTPIARSEPIPSALLDANDWFGHVSTELDFVAGDAVQLKAYQSSGGPLALSTFIYPWMTVSWKRPL
jgi:hypothetical protein